VSTLLCTGSATCPDQLAMGPSCVARAWNQGLTLVHSSAQPQPFIDSNSTHRPIVSHKKNVLTLS